jgi:hypothetical protein
LLGLRTRTGGFNFNRLLVYLIVMLALIAVSFPFWRPIAFPDPVEVSFAEFTPEQQTYVRTLPADRLALLRQIVAENPARAADIITALQRPIATFDDRLPPGDTVRLAEGGFTTLDALRGAAGTAVLYRLEGIHFLRLEAMNVLPGPALHVFLSSQAAPTGVAAFDRDLGPLKGTAGNMLYRLDFAPTGFLSVMLYDVTYQQVHSSAPLVFR